MINQKIIRSALAFSFVITSLLACAHGPTMCLGSITRAETSATLDLRIGVGLVHSYIDPDDNAVVTPDEWTSGSAVLTGLLRNEVLMAVGDAKTSATRMEVSVNDASELRVDADFAWDAGTPPPALTIPFLKRLSGLPPAIISVWDGKQMVTPPTVVYFNRTLPLFSE